MKITFLGTSHGDPTIGHNNTSILLETSGQYYLVDAGEPADAALVQRHLCAAQLQAVFITHTHVDHTGSLPFLCEQANKYRRRFPDICMKVLLPEPEAVTGLAAWLNAQHTPPVQNGHVIDSYAADVFFNDGVISVEAIPNAHLSHVPGARSYALKVTEIASGKQILFTGDLNGDFHDFPLEAAQGCAIVCSELTHYSLDEAIPTLEKLHAGLLAFYHIGNAWQTDDAHVRLLTRCACLSLPVMMTYDGCILEI